MNIERPRVPSKVFLSSDWTLDLNILTSSW
jgi:hypothetical protein